MWRCAETPFGYCQGEPDWATPPHDKQIAGEKASPDKVGGICKLRHLTCGRFSSGIPDPGDVSGHYTHIHVKTKQAEDKLHKKGRKQVEKVVQQEKLF